MEHLTDRQRRIFEDTNFAYLATNGEDGYPSVSPVWVDLDGELEMIHEGARAHIDKLAKKYMGVDTYPGPPEEERVILKIQVEAVSAMISD